MQHFASSTSPPSLAPRDQGAQASRWRSQLLQLLLFGCSAAIYWLSPVTQVTDSLYALAPAHALLDTGTLRIDRYIERKPPHDWGFLIANGDDYQVEQIRGRLYHFFPPGTGVLAAPLVAVARLAGVQPLDNHGKYDLDGDARLQRLIAAIACAGTVLVLFRAARRLLPVGPSLAAAGVVGLGSPLWSSASRALWSDTMACLLGAVAVDLLLRATARNARPNGLLLGTVLAWMFFTRPQSACAIVPVFLFLAVKDRKALLPSALVAATWLGLFVVWSQMEFGKPLPSYFHGGRLSNPHFFDGLVGSLLSPSRGLLLYVPTVPVLAFYCGRHWRDLRSRALAFAVAAIAVANLLLIANFRHWWGGFSFGPRLATGALPWLFCLAILVIDARRTRLAISGQHGGRVWAWLWTITSVAAISIHSQGALEQATWRWNAVPNSVDQHPGRLWDWTHPQFLAAWQRTPRPMPPAAAPVYALLPADSRVEFGDRLLADSLLGWGSPEGGGRWTVGSTATIHLRLQPARAVELHLHLQPNLAGGRLTRQRVRISLNGTMLEEHVFSRPTPLDACTLLPADLVRTTNEVRLELPDCATPNGRDPRQLGVYCSSCLLRAP